MSLAEFQRAFADLIASPPLVLAARSDADGVLAGYDLGPRERRRLAAMLNDAGMSINCTLFRVNRLTPLYSVLPLTCAWLGEALSPELDAYWAVSREATLQYGPEASRFGAWLQERICAGALPSGPIEDAIRFELAAFEVRTASRELPADCDPHPRRRVLRLRWPAQVVLSPDPNSAVPPEREEWILLDATGDDLQVHRLESSTSSAARTA